MKQLQEIRGKDTAELKLDLQTLYKEQFELTFHSADDASSHARPRQIRRHIARIKTILREREMAAASAPATQPATEGEKS